MATTDSLLSLDDVVRASERIAGRLHRTPLLSSRTLSERTGAEVHLHADHASLEAARLSPTPVPLDGLQVDANARLADDGFSIEALHLQLAFLINQRMWLSLARGQAAPLEDLIRRLPVPPPDGGWATLFVGNRPVRQRPGRRQDMPPAWVMNGAIYLFKTQFLFDPLEPNLYGDRVAAMVMPPPYGFNLDDPEDWERAEQLLRTLNRLP